MAEKHSYDVTIDGDTYTVESDSPLSDVQAYEYAKSQVPFDVKKQVATMRSNMAKQPGEAELQARAASEPWTKDAMVARAKSGLKGEAEGFGAGLATPAVLAYHVVRHPLETADAVGTGVLGAGALAAQAVAHPGETYDAAKHAVIRFGSNPEAIGAAAGGLDAALVMPPLLKAAKGTKVGQAVVAGVSDAANRIPGVRAARAILKPTAPMVAKAPKPTAAQTKAAEEAARLAANGVVPVADAAAANPDIAAAARRTPIVGSPNQPTALSQVVPTADAAAANPTAAAAARRLPIVDNTVPPELADPTAGQADAIRSRVVPLADESARTLHSVDNPSIPNRSYNGVGDYDLSNDNIFADTQVPNDLEVVGNDGQPITNGSGDSAASAEALSRQSGMKARGEQFVVRKGNTERVLIGPDAADYTPQSGETYGIKTADGTFNPLQVGSKSGAMSHAEHLLIGNRNGSGGLSLAERQKLLRALTNRSGQ